MSSASTAKKTAKGSGPTWSKVSGASGQKAAAKPAAKPAVKPAAKSGSAGARSSASGSRARQVSRSKAPARKAQSSAPAFEIPAHVRREMLALTVLVVAALSFLGLFTWSSGKQGIVGTAGEVLAQLFGVVAWLVPVSLVVAGAGLLVGQRAGARWGAAGLARGGGAVLLLGQRSGPRWTSLALPVGLGLMLLSLMGFLHLFTSGQPAAEAGQG